MKPPRLVSVVEHDTCIKRFVSKVGLGLFAYAQQYRHRCIVFV